MDGAPGNHIRANFPKSKNREIGSTENCVRESLPKGRIRQEDILDCHLARNERGKCVDVNRVDAPVDNQVARYSEQDQKVNAGIEPVIDIRHELKAERGDGQRGARGFRSPFG